MDKPELSSHEEMILRHIVDASSFGAPLDDFVTFSPADGGTVSAKGEARANLEAITSLIKKNLVDLWIVDVWPSTDYMQEWRAMGGCGEDFPPEFASLPPVAKVVVLATEAGQALAGDLAQPS